MRKIKVAIALLVGLMVFALTATVVHAAPATVASVWTTDSSNTLTNNFSVGNTVYIHWTVGNDGGTVNIYVVDASLVVVATVGSNVGVGSSPLTWIANVAPGNYYIVVQGALSLFFPIAVASIFVVPESALGTVMAATVGFAAFGTVALVKQRRSKKQ